MNNTAMKMYMVLLLLMGTIGYSETKNGQVLFNAPNMPSPAFQFDLDQRVIALVLEDPNSHLAPLFKTVDNLRLYNYRSRSVDFKEFVQYYSRILNKRGWDTLGRDSLDIEKDNLHLYTFKENEIITGIFAIIKSSGDVYLINIVGKIPEKQLGELLLNLNQLGIDIPELMSLRPPDLEITMPLLPPEPEPAISVPEPSVTTGTHKEIKPLLEKPYKLRTQTISVLESLTISGSRGDQIQRSLSDKTLLQNTDTEATPTRFLAADAPIHEIRIRGNRKVSEARIRQTLENGSEDIEQALKSLFKVMPYFEEVRLQVNEENLKYIATITVNEKPLSTDVYLGLNPTARLGFNRVTGWEVGTGLEFGRRKEVGPFWLWNVRNSELNQNSNLFGKVSYAFGNPHLHYRAGGTANWGTPYVWNLGLTAQIHRLTDVVAPELFRDYRSGVSVFQRVLGMPDFQNYYLRQGAEIALQWAPVMPVHWFKLAMVTESHTSLSEKHRLVCHQLDIQPPSQR